MAFRVCLCCVNIKAVAQTSTFPLIKETFQRDSWQCFDREFHTLKCALKTYESGGKVVDNKSSLYDMKYILLSTRCPLIL